MKSSQCSSHHCFCGSKSSIYGQNRRCVKTVDFESESLVEPSRLEGPSTFDPHDGGALTKTRRPAIWDE
jgi:hypothetical protein